MVYMKGQSYVILAIILVIIIAVFAVINVSPVEVNYLFWKMESHLILVILFSVLMGGLITGAAGMVKIFRLQREIIALRVENKQMKKVIQKNELKDQININKKKIQSK